MKKLSLYILMFLFLFTFSACKAKAPEEINMHVDSHFTATMEELSLEGVLIYTEDGEMYLDISSPDELYSLSYSYGDNLTIGYLGLNAMTETDYLSDFAFAKAVKNTLDDALSSSPAIQYDEKSGFTAKGKTKSGCYTLFVDEKGNIRNIEIEPLNIKVRLESNNT